MVGWKWRKIRRHHTTVADSDNASLRRQRRASEVSCARNDPCAAYDHHIVGVREGARTAGGPVLSCLQLSKDCPGNASSLKVESGAGVLIGAVPEEEIAAARWNVHGARFVCSADWSEAARACGC